MAMLWSAAAGSHRRPESDSNVTMTYPAQKQALPALLSQLIRAVRIQFASWLLQIFPCHSLRSRSATTPSFWARQSGPVKQGIKTGLAGTITYAIYSGWHLPQGYWAVFTALVVTQANLGASWKDALYRTVGSTCGAVAAALLLPLLGTGAVRAGVALFILASFFAYLTALHPMFSAAGFTAALILVFGGIAEPWHMA